MDKRATKVYFLPWWETDYVHIKAEKIPKTNDPERAYPFILILRDDAPPRVYHHKEKANALKHTCGFDINQRQIMI